MVNQLFIALSILVHQCLTFSVTLAAVQPCEVNGIDLSGLYSNRDPYSVIGPNGVYTYTFNLCGPLAGGCDGQESTAVCQTWSTGQQPLGNATTQVLTRQLGGGVAFSWTGGVNGRTATVNITCLGAGTPSLSNLQVISLNGMATMITGQAYLPSCIPQAPPCSVGGLDLTPLMKPTSNYTIPAQVINGVNTSIVFNFCRELSGGCVPNNRAQYGAAVCTFRDSVQNPIRNDGQYVTQNITKTANGIEFAYSLGDNGAAAVIQVIRDTSAPIQPNKFTVTTSGLMTTIQARSSIGAGSRSQSPVRQGKDPRTMIKVRTK